MIGDITVGGLYRVNKNYSLLTNVGRVRDGLLIVIGKEPWATDHIKFWFLTPRGQCACMRISLRLFNHALNRIDVA